MNKIPAKSDKPYDFHCQYCGRKNHVEPKTGDRRYRYCGEKCCDDYWRAHREDKERGWTMHFATPDDMTSTLHTDANLRALADINVELTAAYTHVCQLGFTGALRLDVKVMDGVCRVHVCKVRRIENKKGSDE